MKNVIVKSIRENETWDITNSCEELTLETSLFDQPGRLSFTLLDNSDYPRGSVITVEVGEYKAFYGYIFETTVSEEGKTQVTAYDQMRYLQNEDYLQYSGVTADQVFSDICKRKGLKSKVVTGAAFVNGLNRHKANSMFSIIKFYLDNELRETRKMFLIRDNFGVLEFLKIDDLKTDLIVGAGSLMTSFSFVRSIDEDTYNVVKLTRDNKETGERDAWQAEDADSMKRWGVLSYLDTADDTLNEAQVKALAGAILALKNRETRSLSFSAIGFYNLKAGDGIKVQIPGLLDEWFFIREISTTICHGHVEMNIEVFIV